ncbi:hypothetical protein TanjilG_04050 [Lupinus angustifolius]|uniref:Uncharacterized protein n=1 Tax=Lupinus angustifolius TaxID=3871 RepID=A0A4P1RAZ6_LUPAN|nr:hypothetical protein TanjilG_04050 [Lupinus angustifolius]
MNSIHVQLPSSFLVKKSSLRGSKTFPSFKCYSSSSESNIQDDESKDSTQLFRVVDQQVQDLLTKKENKVMLDGIEKASQRVELAKRELAFIQKQELALKQFKDYVNHLEAKAVEGKIAECQREISDAKTLIEEAERSLSAEDEGKKIDRDKERWESVKAASISALIGTLSGLPICYIHITNPAQLLLPLAINFISCALFGVTFRYSVRRNLDDVQLKTGVAAAFGVVKGLAMLDGGPPLELNFDSFLSHAQYGTIYVSENLFIFVSAAIALDYCFKTRLLSPFPIE